jgi:hypothetical protein
VYSPLRLSISNGAFARLVRAADNGNKCWAPHSPGLPVKLIGVDEIHALSSVKAAQASVAWCRVPEIQVKPFFAFPGVPWA